MNSIYNFGNEISNYLEKQGNLSELLDLLSNYDVDDWEKYVCFFQSWI